MKIAFVHLLDYKLIKVKTINVVNTKLFDYLCGCFATNTC